MRGVQGIEVTMSSWAKIHLGFSPLQGAIEAAPFKIRPDGKAPHAKQIKTVGLFG
jgi:hypothetical protein